MPPNLAPQILFDKLCQVMRVGFVNARMPEKMRVKVTLKDMPGGALVTDWLPVLTPRASQDMQYDLPDIGDQVLCFFLPYGHEQGFVAGSMYGKQTPPVQDGEKWHRTFKDGAYLEYDRANHALKADIPGTAELKCANSITLEAPIIYLRGTLVNTAKDGSPGVANFSGGMTIQNGGLNVTSGDVVASGVSLVSHTTEGVQAGNDTSSHPTGGSAESPGTGAMELPAIGSLEYEILADAYMVILRHSVEGGNKPSKEIDELILCLPEILASMADREEDKDIKECLIILGAMIKHWLTGTTVPYPNITHPFTVEWKWAIKFFRVKAAYNEFVNKDLQEGTIYSPLAMKSLAKILCREKIPVRQKEPVNFDFLNIPPEKLETHYYTLKKIPWELEDLLSPLGIYAAMGEFALRALPAGSVQYLENDQWRVTLKKVGVFVHDVFNFQDSIIWDEIEKRLPLLGFWSCKYLDGAKKTPGEGYHGLNNHDFQNFKNNYGYGKDFLVLSDVHIVEDSKEVSYVFTCPKYEN